MLSSSGNKAVEELTKMGMNLSSAVKLIHAITSINRKEAERVLTQASFESTEYISRILNFTHGSHDPPPTYLFIYNDMVEKALALEYIGRWNFEKAENFKKYIEKYPNRISRGILDHSSKENVRLMWSLAEGPWMQDKEAYETSRDKQRVVFSNGLEMDLDSFDARLESKEFGSGIPKSILYMENGQLREKTLENSNLIFSALLIKDASLKNGEESTTYRTVLADGRLIKSLLFRLYYLGGEGFEYLKKSFVEENVDNRVRIYIYEVDWPALRS
jgi:hypothetical protein